MCRSSVGFLILGTPASFFRPVFGYVTVLRQRNFMESGLIRVFLQLRGQ